MLPGSTGARRNPLAPDRQITRHVAAALALVASLAVAAPLAALEDDSGDLEAAARALKEREVEIDRGRDEAAALGAKVETYGTQVDALRIKSIDVAATMRGLERRLDEIEARVATLSAETKAQEAALVAGRPARANTIGAMLRLSRRPPQALMLAPNSAVEATRSALLLAALSRGLETSARTLKASLHDLAVSKAALASERASLDETTRELAGQRTALEGLMMEKAALERSAEVELTANDARIAGLVRQARDLEELIARLEASASAEPVASGLPLPPPPRPNPSARLASLGEQPLDEGVARAAGTPDSALDQEAMRASETPRQGGFALPAEGAIVRNFGTPTAPGVTARGLSISVRPGGPVVAPFAGKVVFAGPFRHYGQLLIIAHGEGYHSLLAGLGRIDAAIGRWVMAGEPVGTMSSSPETRPQLYLDLRHNGRPVNPSPWLATGPSKSSGS